MTPSPLTPLRPPRVLLLLHELTRTGAPGLALGTFEALSGKIELRMVAQTGGPLADRFRRLGNLSILSRDRRDQPHHRTHLARKSIAVSWDSAVETVARFAVARWRPDVVYVNSVHALPLVARMGVRGLPTILHVHELTVALACYEAAHPGLIRAVPERYVAVSSAVREELADRYRIDRERITIVRPFVVVPVTLVPGSVSASGESGRVVVGGMGNPSWYKGLPLWLLAAREVADQLGEDRVRFTWIGIRDTDEGRQARAMAAKLRLDSIVDFVPESEDVAQHLARLDVLAMSSWEEAAPLTVLEAMAQGIPVVSFAGSGGPAEEIGEAGVIVRDFSPAGMAHAIADLARHPAQRKRLGLAGRERAQSAFSRETSVAAILNQIASLSSARTV